MQEATQAGCSTESGPGRAAARTPGGVTAFVGRALKGPVGRPVPIRGFDEYQRVFGGLWQPSTLSYAIEQYFDNGGREALVVRVASGARGPTLRLPAGREQLQLAGVNPGSREYLRAAIDYDGIPAGAGDCFNLVLQRLASAGTERVTDQEFFREVSLDPQSPRCLAGLLPLSGLARLAGPLPSVRPDRTGTGPYGILPGYAASGTDGDDGAPLSDYDIIGSQLLRTGLSALGADDFDLLYIPPLTRDRDLGSPVLLVAERLCRERRALLVVDPPRRWSQAREVLEGMGDWPLRSEHAAMFFPRVLATDRLRNRPESFAPGAAAAAMLSRRPQAREMLEPALRPGLALSLQLPVEECERLARAGVNVLRALRPAPGRGAGPKVRSTGCTALAARGAGDLAGAVAGQAY